MNPGEFPSCPEPAPTSIVLFHDAALAEGSVDHVLGILREWSPRVHARSVEAGESLKEASSWQALLHDLASTGLDRGGLVVALGGGSVGDAVGFAAAVWLRGVRWLGIPTTLMGMVDAFHGGKTGINLKQGKNLVGAFHMPVAVAVLPEMLRTLPERELRSGWAEVLKAALIGDRELFALCLGGERGPEVPGEPGLDTLTRAIAVKQAIVAEDPLEGDRRRVLNLGHTLGHALEAHHGPGVIAHGEAVATGLVFATRVAAHLGHCDPGLEAQIQTVLERWQLPTVWPEDAAEDLIAAMHRDKKRVGGRLAMALPHGPGDVRMHDVDDAILRTCLGGSGRV